MARPLHAHLSLPALRANLARARELAPNAEVLAVVKADAYGHGIMRVLPALDAPHGLALVELDTAIEPARCTLCQAHFAARGILHARRASRNIAITGSPLSCTTRTSCECSSATRLEQPIEVFIKINTGMNRLGIRRDRGREDGRAPQQLPVGRRAAADDALRSRGRGLRNREAARRIQRRVPGNAVSALASPTRPASSATPRSAARSCGPGSCSTARRPSRTMRRLRSACGR